MKKQALLFFALSIYAFGQGVRYDVPPILNSRAVLVPNANISLCPGTATITNSTCSPASTQAFTDITLTTPCATGSPVVLPQTNVCSGVADSLGNAGFWLAPGAYIYCINSPSITGKCYNLTVPAGVSASGSAIITSGLLNNACWVDGIKYTTIAAANADTINCRTIVIPPKPSGAIYSETLTANFTGSATLREIIFLTDANITMGTNTFTIPSSGTSDNFVIWSPFVSAGISNSGQGVNFISTATSGTVMTFGGTTQRNAKWNIQGINLDITAAGTGVTGMLFNNLFNSKVEGVGVTCNLSGTNTQTGMSFNGSGTPGFADLVSLSIRPVDCQKPLILNNTNGYEIMGGYSEINCGNTTGGVGITITGTGGLSGTTFALWPDVEACPTLGVDIGTNNNKLMIRAENLGGGTAAKFESGVVENDVIYDTPTLACTDVSGSNGRNHCGDIGGGNWSGGSVASTVIPAGATAGQVAKVITSRAVYGSGTAVGYGLIAGNQMTGDAVGDKGYAIYAETHSGTALTNEIGIRVDTDGGDALEAGILGGAIGMRIDGAAASVLDGTENAAPSGIASHDLLYPDSTAHAWKIINNNGTAFQVAQVIIATSAAFATATTAGTCVNNTTAVAGAATTMAVSVSPVSTPGVGAVWSAFVSSAGNVTINECAVATSAGGTIAFNIRVTP